MSSILKIRQLRALAASESTTGPEREAAARAADRLCEKAGLQDVSVELPENPHQAREVARMPAIPMWINNLLFVLQSYHGCDGYFERVGDRKWSYVAFGRPENVEAFKADHAYYAAEIKIRSANQWSANSYRVGMTLGLHRAFLEEMRARPGASFPAGDKHIAVRKSDLKSHMPADVEVVSTPQPQRSVEALDHNAVIAGELAGYALKRTFLRQVKRALLLTEALKSCPHCRAEVTTETRYAHARPDGRRCRKAEQTSALLRGKRKLLAKSNSP